MRRSAGKLLAAGGLAMLAWLGGAAGLSQLSGCGKGGKTPEDTFRLCVESVRKEDYGKVWDLLSDRMRRKWEEGVGRQREEVRGAGPRRSELEPVIRQQYLCGLPEFLSLPAKDLYLRNLKVRRNWILEWELAGPATVEGESARLSIATGPDQPPLELLLVHTGGGWLVDDAPNQAHRR